jgi:FkbM family methyltransferase
MRFGEIPERLSPGFRAEVDVFIRDASRLGQYDACLELLQRCRARFPRVPGFARDEARMWRSKGDFWACAKAWSDFSELSPSPVDGIPERYAQAWRTKATEIDSVKMSLAPGFGVMSDQVRFVLADGKYEGSERAALTLLLEPGDRVLECGAGAGYMALCASKLFPGLAYTAVEANPELGPLIRENQALNECEFQLVEAAIGASAGMIEFEVMDNFMASRISTPDAVADENWSLRTRLTVRQLALDELLAETRANCLIMDIEGAEHETLTRSSLRGVNKLLLEIHPRQLGRARVAQLLHHLLSLGFEPDLDAGSKHVFSFTRVAA